MKLPIGYNNLSAEGLVLNLLVARKLFDTLRNSGRIAVRRHASKDHPERKFTPEEVVALIKTSGILRENYVDNPAPDSFVWHCKDDLGRNCELCIVFQVDDDGDLIMVISAFRRV
jgi:hypothetical protein